MNLNRNIQPKYKNIETIHIPTPVKTKLYNGIETYIINAGTEDIVKIDFTFNAGSWYQDKPIIATCANEMLMEGTKQASSQQIAEKLDYYGAFIHTAPTKDFGNVTLYTLKKYLPQTIQILEDIIKNPTYPENELKIFLNKRKQQFQVDLEKVTNIARREFNEQVFGKDHPYGTKTQLSDYDKVTQEDLILFHKQYYHSGNCKIIISGKVNDSDVELLNHHFGNNDWINNSETKPKQIQIIDNPTIESVIEKANVSQSAIRLGKILINKDHQDYHKLNIVNTILGGYFGSRLMKTIREEKGYTYGISSVLVSLKNAGYIVILSEVSADTTKSAIQDIKIEIKKLRDFGTNKEELDLVKNYMLGDLLRSFDGPFEISSSFKSLIDFDLDMNYFNQAIDTVKSITVDEIKNIANKYFQEDTFIKTIAGKYN